MATTLKLLLYQEAHTLYSGTCLAAEVKDAYGCIINICTLLSQRYEIIVKEKGKVEKM